MNYESLALDLLDFCGGEEPVFENVKSFMLARELYLNPHEISMLLITANQLLTAP